MPQTLIPPPFMSQREKDFYDTHRKNADKLGDAFLVAAAALTSEQQPQQTAQQSPTPGSQPQTQMGDGTRYDPTLDTYI